MTRPRPDSVEVCVDLPRFPGATPMGRLDLQRGGAGERMAFTFSPEWVREHGVIDLDPDLPPSVGRIHPPQGRMSFGVFLDCAPDRWGRSLMQRRENLRALRESRRARALTDWDFLLGVHDESRMGALRLRAPGGSAFIDNDPAMAVPPITSVGALQAASLRIEGDDGDAPPDDRERWLALLVAPGSSLGGARPKASVRNAAGELCIAKFASRYDERDVGAWEWVVHELADMAGIRVPPARIVRMAADGHATFISTRFDRTVQGRRLAFVSAMTLTQRMDGEPGASYLELVDVLQSRGADTARDCEQLFRRVLFNILVRNTDDHLRNHGFLVEANGVRLSPAYDLNPSLDRDHLSLAIDEVQDVCDVSVAMAAYRDYGLTAATADRVLGEVRAAVAHWRMSATRALIPRAEQETMAAAFQAVD